MSERNSVEALNEYICRKDGWRHTYVEKWVKIENGALSLEFVVSAYIDGELEIQRPFPELPK